MYFQLTFRNTPVSAVLYSSTFVEWQVLLFWYFRFRCQFFDFVFNRFLFSRFSFRHFFVFVLVFVNEWVIFSFFTIYTVFVNENQTAATMTDVTLVAELKSRRINLPICLGWFADSSVDTTVWCRQYTQLALTLTACQLCCHCKWLDVAAMPHTGGTVDPCHWHPQHSKLGLPTFQ